jgi:hypothetical protein
MPAGSGPNVNQTQPGALAADTAEHVICTIPPQNWNGNPLGMLVSFSAYMTGLGAGTVTFRIRQGNAITGTQVGVSVVLTVANAGTYVPAAEFQDLSAFAVGPQPASLSPAGTPGGQYVLTYQQSVASIASIGNAILELETVAPLI